VNLDEEDFEIVKEMDQYQPLEELVLPRKNYTALKSLY